MQHGLTELLGIRHIAARALQRRADGQRRVIALTGIEGREAIRAILLGPCFHELLVGRIVEVGVPVRRAIDADCRIADSLQESRIDRWRGYDHRNGTEQTGLLILAGESDAETTGMEMIDGVGFAARICAISGA